MNICSQRICDQRICSLHICNQRISDQCICNQRIYGHCIYGQRLYNLHICNQCICNQCICSQRICIRPSLSSVIDCSYTLAGIWLQIDLIKINFALKIATLLPLEFFFIYLRENCVECSVEDHIILKLPDVSKKQDDSSRPLKSQPWDRIYCDGF